MKTNDINQAIEQLEKQIQYLQSDYEVTLKAHDTCINLSDIRMQIKQAQESLRLKKKFGIFFSADYNITAVSTFIKPVLAPSDHLL